MSTHDADLNRIMRAVSEHTWPLAKVIQDYAVGHDLKPGEVALVASASVCWILDSHGISRELAVHMLSTMGPYEPLAPAAGGDDVQVP